MKLIRVGAVGSEKPGVLISDLHYVDVSDLVVDFNEAFFENANLHDLQSEVERQDVFGWLSRARFPKTWRTNRRTSSDYLYRVKLRGPRG